MKKLFQLLILSLGLTAISYAESHDDWPYYAICMWLEQTQTHEGYLIEAKKRGLSCGGGGIAENQPGYTGISTMDVVEYYNVNTGEIITGPSYGAGLGDEWLRVLEESFSTQGSPSLEIYSCETKQSLDIYYDEIADVREYTPNLFIFKLEKDKFVFDEEKSKRPRIASWNEYHIIASSESDLDIEIYAADVINNQIRFIYNLEEDYGYLTISNSIGFGGISNLIAKCIVL
jgi:hypothetical protein